MSVPGPVGTSTVGAKVTASSINVAWFIRRPLAISHHRPVNGHLGAQLERTLNTPYVRSVLQSAPGILLLLNTNTGASHIHQRGNHTCIHMPGCGGSAQLSRSRTRNIFGPEVNNIELMAHLQVWALANWP